MAKFILDGQEYGGGSSGSNIVKLTQAEYDALSNDKLSNDTIYLITDSGELAAENLFYDGSQTGLGNNVQSAIDELNSNIDEQNKKTDYIKSHFNWHFGIDVNDILPITADTEFCNFTNWSNNTDFPAQYGSGIILPCKDAAEKRLIYATSDRFWIGTWKRSTGTISWIEK